MILTEQLVEKWKDILSHPDLPKITDIHRRNVTARCLENTLDALKEEHYAEKGGRLLTEAPSIPVNAMGASSSTASDGPFDTYDPILISLVRRAMPNLMAYDICGVQEMTGPTGLIFAMRARYTNTSHTETFYNEVNTAHSTVRTGANTLSNKHVGTLPGNTTQTSNLAETGLYNYAGAMSRAQAEALGTTGNTAWPEMAFSIEKITATANSRALQARYTHEIAQDMRNVHGLDVDTELSNILTAEVLAEINREIVRLINVTAKQGATEGTTTSGIFDLDTDSNGRWMVEKFKGLMFQIEREANKIAKDTRRGKGNILICSSDVASALNMAGILDYTPALNSNNLQVDDTGNTFAGVLNNRMRVYIDPYVDGGQYMVVGYKGASKFDAGVFYCPYVPLTKYRAIDPETYTPRIGYKTRYAVVANPFAEGITAGAGVLTKDSNVYYRRILVSNIM